MRAPRQDAPADTRLVRVDGEELFRVEYCRRQSRQSERSQQHGITSESIAAEYCSAIESYESALCGPKHQWPRWNAVRHGCCTVTIRDLGPGLIGSALTDGISAPSLALSCRNFSSSPQQSGMMRKNVVLHELVHLHQFLTDTWNHWPRLHRWGVDDPNWWLHEAVALAIEAEFGVCPATWYPWLWTWATIPERSLESDTSGTLAAPFLQFLIRRFGSTFAADIYRLTPNEVPDMYATQLLNHAIRAFSTSDSAVAPGSTIETVFLDYCTHAGLIGCSGCMMDPSIAEVVGQRTRTAVVDRLPFAWTSEASTLDHLACRYFEFPPPTAASGRLCVVVRQSDSEQTPSLRASLAFLNANGEICGIEQLQPDRLLKGITAKLNASEETARILLTVANVAHADGWALSDGTVFSVEAVPA